MRAQLGRGELRQPRNSQPNEIATTDDTHERLLGEA
jgi:hypothetical protein